MFCIGYDADTGQKYYVDSNADTYTGAPYAEYGLLTPVKGPTTAREDNCTQNILHILHKILTLTVFKFYPDSAILQTDIR
jgi:hypothetical protein